MEYIRIQLSDYLLKLHAHFVSGFLEPNKVGEGGGGGAFCGGWGFIAHKPHLLVRRTCLGVLLKPALITLYK